MMTVHEVAEHYGVSDAFMVRALDRIGFKNAEPDTGLPTPTVTRFEAAFGDKIRAAQPKPPHLATAESDTDPAAARSVRQPKPHGMRVARAKVTSGRDASGHRAKRLLENPGPRHTIDETGPNDGDPWDGEVVPGAVYFYDEPAKAGQCPRCAAAVSEGKGFRTFPHEREYRSYLCEAYLRLRMDGRTASTTTCPRRSTRTAASRKLPERPEIACMIPRGRDLCRPQRDLLGGRRPLL